MLSTISLKKKLLLIAVSLSSLFIVLSTRYFLYVRCNVIEQQRYGLEPNIKFVETLINRHYQGYLDGKLNLVEAQQKSIKEIHQINFRSKNYVFVFNDDYLLLESMNNVAILNKNVKHEINVNDVKLYQLLRTEAIYRHNAGYSSYFYYGNTNREQQLKISYSQYFSPWGWTYGEGVYINEIDNSIINMLISN